jgi:hypothetical protein
VTGLTIMVDEVQKLSSDISTLSRALGRVEASVEEAKAQNADIKGHLIRQDERAETNKNLAIAARTETEARQVERFDRLEQKTTLTYGLASAAMKFVDETGVPLAQWHREEGSKLGGRVSLLEQARIAEATERAQAETARAGQEGELRGKAWMVAKIIALVVAIGGILGWLGADRISAMLFTMAVRLGHE